MRDGGERSRQQAQDYNAPMRFKSGSGRILVIIPEDTAKSACE